MGIFIRLLGGAGLLYLVYFEAGPWTVVVLALLLLGSEMIAHILRVHLKGIRLNAEALLLIEELLEKAKKI